MIEHQQYGHPCPCDIAEVTEREAEFLELMDNWYGDKSYRCHREWLEILNAVADADRTGIQDQAWNAGFDACPERLVGVSKRLTVLELLLASVAHRSQDEVLQERWRWYKSLPMVDAMPISVLDKDILVSELLANEPHWSSGDHLGAGWHAAIQFIRQLP